MLEENTDAGIARALNAAGHRSGEGKPFTSRIVLDLRRAHHMPGHAERLRARGLLDMAEITEALGVHRTTIKNWHRAGLLISHKANDKNQRLFDAPAPGDPRLVARQGSPIRNRALAGHLPLHRLVVHRDALRASWAVTRADPYRHREAAWTRATCAAVIARAAVAGPGPAAIRPAQA